MRKISRISHLHKEQERLRRRSNELESAIRKDWLVIRYSLQPAPLTKEAFSLCSSWIGKKILSSK